MRVYIVLVRDCRDQQTERQVEMAGRATTMGFLGAGQMATALARGFIRAGMTRDCKIICREDYGRTFVFTGYVGKENIIASATSAKSTSLRNIQVDL